MDSAVVCAIIKGEDFYIEEWIIYNLKLGFSKIYIYDNSDDNSYSYLEDIFGDYITVTHFPGLGQQIQVYNTFFRSHGKNHKWAATIDVDEFIILKKHDNIIDLLKEYCISGSLALNWVMIGSCDQKIYIPKDVISRFLYRPFNIHQNVKVITVCEDFDSFWYPDPHWCDLRAGTCQHDTSGKQFRGPFNPNGPTDIAVINHYYTKSYDEFIWKRDKGTVTDGRILEMSYFGDHNINEVHDPSALDFYNKPTPDQNISKFIEQRKNYQNIFNNIINKKLNTICIISNINKNNNSKYLFDYFLQNNFLDNFDLILIDDINNIDYPKFKKTDYLKNPKNFSMFCRQNPLAKILYLNLETKIEDILTILTNNLDKKLKLLGFYNIIGINNFESFWADTNYLRNKNIKDQNWWKPLNYLLLDNQNIKLQAYYGNTKKFIDITNKLSENFISNNCLFIPKNTGFNNYFGDPLPNIVKKIVINYKNNIYEIPENTESDFQILLD